VNLSNTLALGIANLDLDVLKRIRDTGIDQFWLEASQAVCNRVPAVYDFGWLDRLMENIAKVTSKPPYILSCRLPLWMNTSKGSWRNLKDPKHPELGMLNYPFCTEIPDDMVHAVMEYDAALIQRFPQVNIYIRDMELNLPSWWTSGAETFARQMILAPSTFVFKPAGKQLVGPGITIMEGDKKDNKQGIARDCFKQVMQIAASAIDFPSVHSYPQSGKKINGVEVSEGAFPIRALIQFAGWTGLDFTKGNVWLSETGMSKRGMSKREGEEKQLQLYKTLFAELTSLSEEQPLQIHQILLYDSISDANGLFHSDGSPTLAMQWISENYLR